MGEAIKMFDPVTHGLEATFRLTSFDENRHSYYNHQPIREVASLSMINEAESILIQGNQMVYLIVDDPYMMGKIACESLLNKIYQIGITECDKLEMLIANSNRMLVQQRNVVNPLMFNGFRDAAYEVGMLVNEASTYGNQWSSIGGTVSISRNSSQIVYGNNAQVGDVLILTKPLGTQIAIKTFHLRKTRLFMRCKQITQEEINHIYVSAVELLARTNRDAAKLMHEFQASCATDTSEHGLLFHAKSLAACQKHDVSFKIVNIPIIPKVPIMASVLGDGNALLNGLLTETSGGLLICIPQEKAEAFVDEHIKRTGDRVWVVGTVIPGNRTAEIIRCPRILGSDSDYL